MTQIANHDLSKVLGRANECMRRLIEAGLTFEDLQLPINDPEMRERLVRYWKNPVQALARNTIAIDRSKKFDPKSFLSFLSDHLNDRQKKTYLVKEQDQKALLLKEIDLNGVILESGRLPEEKIAGIDACIDRLRYSGRILLDAQIFEALWQNQHLIPKSWQMPSLENGRSISIVFAGTLFADEEHYVERFKLEALCLSYYKNEWHRWKECLVNSMDNIVFATLPDFSN